MSDVERFVRFCESEFGATVMDREAAYIREHVDPDDDLLDVGCGIGSLEERLPAHDVLGVDRSERMISAARRRAPGEFLVGDARGLPIRPDAVDAVLFVATLEFVSEVDDAIDEALRVLRPDGTLVALLLNTRSDYVQTQLQRDASYFQRMVNRDTDALADDLLARLAGHREYVLGIDGETVVERRDPTTAAITAVVGTPAKTTE